MPVTVLCLRTVLARSTGGRPQGSGHLRSSGSDLTLVIGRFIRRSKSWKRGSERKVVVERQGADLRQTGVVDFVALFEPVHGTVVVAGVDVPPGDVHWLIATRECLRPLSRHPAGQGPAERLQDVLRRLRQNLRRGVFGAPRCDPI